MMAQGTTGQTTAPCNSFTAKSEHMRARERGDKGLEASKPRCQTWQWAQGNEKAASRGFHGGGRAQHLGEIQIG